MQNNGTRATLLEHAGIPESDWALAGIPDNVNATGLLAEDLEDEYGGTCNDAVITNALFLFENEITTNTLYY